MDQIGVLLRAASFAAKAHRLQKRKGGNRDPYINHPLEVANLLANVGNVGDIDVLIAGLLHDTVEDCGVSPDEIAETFGETVRRYVVEVTDDKSLPDPKRKQLQIEHAPRLSRGAKLVKLADKISNITDIANDPPHDWSDEKRREYIEWGEKVVAGLRGASPELESYFDKTVKDAKAKLGA